METPLVTLLAFATLTILVTAAATDVTERIIPNRLVVAVMAIGVTLRLLSDPGAAWISLAIWAAALLAMGVLATYLVVGWGDAKLIAAATLLVAPGGVGPLLLAIAISGGVLACCYWVARHSLRGRPVLLTAGGSGATALSRVLGRERDRIQAHEPMPYALAILGGTVYYAAARIIQCYPAT